MARASDADSISSTAAQAAARGGPGAVAADGPGADAGAEADGTDGADAALDRALSGAQHNRGGDPASFFGPYQVIDAVGEGGVARVVRARHIHPQFADRHFAVKVLHASLSADPQVVALFRREAYVLAMLEHPHVVRTFEAGVQDGQLFIAMEHVAGRDLDRLLARSRALGLVVPQALLLHICCAVLDGLAYAHALCDADGAPLGLLHRDVNPANVFLGFDGRVKLGDFGVAALSAGRRDGRRELAGKVGYFAPEQLEGGAVDARADVFAAGAMLFEMVCGRRLFDAEDPDAQLRQNRRAAVPRPTSVCPAVGPALERVLLQALARRPRQRFASAAALLAAIQALAPPLPGARRAIAALMRHCFLSEYAGELTLRAGLAERPRAGAPPAPARLLLLAADPRAQDALAAVLTDAGHAVTAAPALAELTPAIADPAAAALFVDLAAADAELEALRAALAQRPARLPVVALAADLSPATLAAAESLRAVDLLFPPLSAARVAVAARAALAPPEAEAGAGVSRPQGGSRLLLVGVAPAVAARLDAALTPLGYRLRQVADAPAALAECEQASYDAVLCSAPTAGAAATLAQAYRQTPGTGVVPFVMLADGLVAAALRGQMLPRSEVLAPAVGRLELIGALARLLADTRAGRSFQRVAAECPAQLRYGGRTWACTTTDLSRGGAMLQCAHVPPLGTEVGLTLQLAPAEPPMVASGRVLRVELEGGAAGDVARVGVSLERFVGRGEAALIRRIGGG